MYRTWARVPLLTGLLLTLSPTDSTGEEAARAAGASRDNSPQSFWYGDRIPEPPAKSIHDFLTAPQGPLAQLTRYMTSFDNSNGQTGLVLHDSRRSWSGYTLLSSLGGKWAGPQGPVSFSILIDMEGNIVREWPLFGFPAKLLPGGHVLGGAGGGLAGHQEQGALVQMDWCGNAVWSWAGTGAPGGARWHHDYQREGNPVGYFAPFQPPRTLGGKTLVLAHANPDPALTRHISDFPLEDDVLHEVDWAGNVLWTWNAWEHYEQMGFDATARAAVRTIKVGAPEDIGGGFEETDWQHINSASYVGPNRWYEQGDLRFHPDNVIWDGRSSNIIAIIARHDHPRGAWKAGDIVWRVGPDYGPGTREHGLGQIIGQHHAHVIPWGLPGAGNVLVFDNGGLAGFGALFPGLPPYWPVTYRDFSRVIEFNPRTLEVVWEYQLVRPEAGERKFFSWFISSAQRLLNGNTLITEGATGRVFEVTRKGDVVWEYISPFERPTPSAFGNAVYRAYRVPSWWLPWNRECPPATPGAGGPP
ncbi:aryl-sulfate sulfotransferase [Myxococcus sp. RHSTA-1-4]|uniref:aryl-sulfate sulfotransferase n=1 Tax=Myxococcus sp. RHSTA-1-4 TaxID=2874601 RepID=UPI001CBE2DAE|nr:aryl-sulfate sulfotransferase [Myxococcus sp. RHSTA-1-4]MBZ4419310.1 aryl-sulfate sulfotransferase [Myxococcus sp. RHSTA-1-4]